MFLKKATILLLVAFVDNTELVRVADSNDEDTELVRLGALKKNKLFKCQVSRLKHLDHASQIKYCI